MKTARQLTLTSRFHPMKNSHGPASPQRLTHTQKLGEREINLKPAYSRTAIHRVDPPSQIEEFPMNENSAPPDDLIVLTRVAPELAPLIVGLPLPYRTAANRIRNADVPAELVEYINGRYYVRRSNLPAFAEALGLRLNPSSLPPAAELAAKPEPASKPARPRASTRRSAA
jgi:hypothetical protein